MDIPLCAVFSVSPCLTATGRYEVVLLGHTEPDIFTPEDEAVLVGLAAQAAIAIENARTLSRGTDTGTRTRRASLKASPMA